jgi:PAT family beta-lactamase induction signal transducer AmpG
MDVTNPAVAGTQFTAYMALANVAIAYSATWQGIAIEAWGYPRMMLIDVMVGVLCLAIIPFLRPTFDAPGVARFLDHVAPRRARFAAGLLGVLCLAWVPTRLWEELLGPARPVAGTFFTLVFVCSALFLLAGGAVLAPTERRLARIGAWFAPFLLLMYLRYYVEPIGAWLKVAKEDSTFHAVADAIALGVPTIGGVLLLTLASRGWEALRPVDNVTNTAA